MKLTDDQIQEEYRIHVKHLQDQVPQCDKDRMAQLKAVYGYRVPPECRRLARLDNQESLGAWLAMSRSERDEWFEKVEKYANRIWD